MVGGVIYSFLGVIISIAGLIALISAYSYSQLSIKYQKSGGAFTFGHYIAHIVNWGDWLPRVLAFSIIAVLALVNLRGISDSSRLEIISVWGKLFVLLGLSLVGIIHWNPEQLTAGIEKHSWYSAIVGAATVFMAYEGFQR